MIKFFRRIRQQLLTENKFSKYVFYAFGEIILVVIGILIALSINNANESKKARIQEIKYLKNLQSDIELEIKNNDNLINYRALTAKAAAQILDIKTLETLSDLLVLEQNIQQVYERKNFIPTNNTYKELTSSGNLNFITNDSIKYSLLELDKNYVSIALMEGHMYREYEEYLYDASVKNGEMLNLLNIQKTAATGVLSFNDPSLIATDSVIQDYNRLLQKKEYINGLKLSVMNNIMLKNAQIDVTSHLQKLNELIKDDLNKEDNDD